MHNTKARRSSERDNIEEKNVRKRLICEQNALTQFGRYFSYCSAILTPRTNLTLDDTTSLFLRRVYRYIDCNLTATFPEIEIGVTLIQLQVLKAKYGAENIVETIPNTKERPLTKKEKKLILTAEYFSQGIYSLGVIASMTGLQKNDVLNMSQRLLKNNEILPTKNKKTKRLQAEHIQYINDLLADEENAFFSLNEIKNHLITEYNNLHDIDTSVIYRALIANGFSFKKVNKIPVQRNLENTKRYRYTVSQKLIYSLYKGFDVVFVDEASINLNSKLNYGWGKRGIKLSVTTRPK